MTAGLISLPFAYANYQKKKAAYDAALEKYESLKASGESIVDAYQNKKSQIDDILLQVDPNGNINQYDQLEGLKLDYTLYVGALVGEKMSIGSELTITNNTNQDLQFLHIETEPTLVGVEMAKSSGDVQYIGYKQWRILLDRGKSVVIRYSSFFHVKFLSKDDMKLLREVICKQAGKKLITSVPAGTECTGWYRTGKEILTVDVNMHRYYTNKEGNTIRTQYRSFNVPGKLVYMGEAWNPGLWDAVKEGLGF